MQSQAPKPSSTLPSSLGQVKQPSPLQLKTSSVISLGCYRRKTSIVYTYTHVHMNIYMQQTQDVVGVLVIYSQHMSVQWEEGFP